LQGFAVTHGLRKSLLNASKFNIIADHRSSVAFARRAFLEKPNLSFEAALRHLLVFFTLFSFVLKTIEASAKERVRSTVTMVMMHESGSVIVEVWNEYIIPGTSPGRTRSSLSLYFGDPSTGVLHELATGGHRINEWSDDDGSSKSINRDDGWNTGEYRGIIKAPLPSHTGRLAEIKIQYWQKHSRDGHPRYRKSRLEVSCGESSICFKQSKEAKDYLATSIETGEVLLQELPEYRTIDFVYREAQTDTYLIIDRSKWSAKAEAYEILYSRGGKVELQNITRTGFDVGMAVYNFTLEDGTYLINIPAQERKYQSVRAPKLFRQRRALALQEVPAAELTEAFLARLGLPQSRYLVPRVRTPCELLGWTRDEFP